MKLPGTRRFPPLDGVIGSRGRLIAKTGSWSLVAKVAAAANLFIAIPFVLHALGPAEFGAWATLVSLVMFAGFLDFGLGNGTMNLVAAAHSRGNTDEVAAVIYEGRRTLIWISALLTPLFLAALPLMPWYRLLGLPASLSGASRIAVAAVLFSVAFAVPLNLANRVQLGLGRGDQAFRWQAAGQLFTLVLVIVLARAHYSFPALTAAAVFGPLIGSLANTIGLLRDPTYAAPAMRRPDLAYRIRHEGWLFFVLQLAAALAYSADLPLISVFCGPDEAGIYAIVQRAFSVIPLSLSLIWAPLWPIYRHALTSGDHDWVKRTLRRSVGAAICVSAVVGSVIAVGFDWILQFWLHRTLTIPPFLLIGFATWALLEAGGTALSTFLNAASVMRFQLVCATIFALLCFGGKTLAIMGPGMQWFPWVMATAWTLTTLLPYLLLRKNILKNAFEREY